MRLSACPLLGQMQTRRQSTPGRCLWCAQPTGREERRELNLCVNNLMEKKSEMAFVKNKQITQKKQLESGDGQKEE